MRTITLDIETMPDLTACGAAGVDPADGFPTWPLHQLLCVSLLTHDLASSDEHAFELETLSRVCLSERAIVHEVEERLAEANSILTYNGRAFDIPLLLARAAVTGERVPHLLRASRRGHVGVHQDLMDTVTCDGAAVRPRLVEVCAALGIPAKLELAGASVAELVAAGDLDRLRRYCEQDVVSTWLAARLWNANRDAMDAADHWAALADWIVNEQPRLAHLLAYAMIPQGPRGGQPLDPSAGAAMKF